MVQKILYLKIYPLSILKKLQKSEYFNKFILIIRKVLVKKMEVIMLGEQPAFNTILCRYLMILICMLKVVKGFAVYSVPTPAYLTLQALRVYTDYSVVPDVLNTALF